MTVLPENIFCFFFLNNGENVVHVRIPLWTASSLYLRSKEDDYKKTNWLFTFMSPQIFIIINTVFNQLRVLIPFVNQLQVITTLFIFRLHACWAPIKIYPSICMFAWNSSRTTKSIFIFDKIGCFFQKYVFLFVYL